MKHLFTTTYRWAKISPQNWFGLREGARGGTFMKIFVIFYRMQDTHPQQLKADLIN